MKKPVNVLMVEDSATDAELLLAELRRRGFTPAARRVQTGPALEAALAERTWDVVISDHNMPSFSGDDALRMVKAQAPDLPFIVVSGAVSEEHAVNAMRAGASDFIVKTRLHRLAPVVERELQERTRRLERRRMAAALAESQHQLREAQKLEAVGRLAGGVAHDFNNLIAAILSYTDIVLKDMPREHAHRADLQEIKRASSRAAKLTRQLLAFSRQQVLDQAVLNPNEVIGDVLQLLRRVAGDRIDIQVSCAPDLWNVKADRIGLEQILMNLVSNARDAMPGGGRLTLATTNVVQTAGASGRGPAEPGSYVRLEVRDTGEGIPDDVLPKIFEPFFTTKPEGKGTGLGLATVHGIVQQSGGSIFVESAAGEGAAFVIYLPRTTEEAAVPLPMPEGRAGDERVLLVDGDPDTLALGVRVLSDAGYRVTTASRAHDALAIAEAERLPFRVLLTPIVMPGMTGLALADQLRARNPSITTVFITTARDAQIDPLEVFERGDILVRPFRPADLLAKVRDALAVPVA
jgi:signal transduction histidine kinase